MRLNSVHQYSAQVNPQFGSVWTDIANWPIVRSIVPNGWTGSYSGNGLKVDSDGPKCGEIMVAEQSGGNAEFRDNDRCDGNKGVKFSAYA